MQGPTLLSRTFLSAKLWKQFTCKWVCHLVWTQRIILKSCCERTNFQISACASQSDFCAVADCIHLWDLWPVFIVLVSTKHPFSTGDVYTGDSVGEKAAWKCTSPASKMTCPSVPPQDNEQTDDCGSREKGKGSSYTFVPKPSTNSSPWRALAGACWGCLQQSWPLATMLAALPGFQMLALIKRSLKSTS